MEAHFNLKVNGNKVSADISGTGNELVSLIASVMSDNKDVSDIIKKATMLCILKDLKDELGVKDEDVDDSKLADMLNNLKKYEA